MARSRLITTAQVVLYVNGNPHSQVTDFRWDSSTPPKAIYGLDSGEPYELAPGVTKVNGNIGLLRVLGDGGLEGLGAIPQLHELPRGKYFALALIERTSDTQIFRADRCWVVAQSWSVPTKGRITGSASFEALDWSNEAKQR